MSRGMSSSRSRKRRKFDGHDVEAIVEVFPEPAGGDGVSRGEVGRGDDPAIGLDHLRAADALERAVLEHAEQLGLHAKRKLADLVEEERTPLRQLKPPLLLTIGAA